MAGLRIAYRRTYATLAENVSSAFESAAEKSSTARAEQTLRRFWKTVDIETLPEGHAVKLDKRNLRTPAGQPLVLPSNKPVLATLIAHEWDSQEKILKQHSLPLTSLASRAIDGLATTEQRALVVEELARYMDTDTVCYQGSQPRQLVRLQKEHWEPLLAWINNRYNLEIKPYNALLGGKQSPQTRAVLLDVVSKFDAYQLAAFERAVLASKSFIISLALLEGHYSVEEAALSALVEVRAQIEQWGEVEDTHDVDHEDIRARLGSAAIALIDKW